MSGLSLYIYVYPTALRASPATVPGLIGSLVESLIGWVGDCLTDMLTNLAEGRGDLDDEACQ